MSRRGSSQELGPALRAELLGRAALLCSPASRQPPAAATGSCRWASCLPAQKAPGCRSAPPALPKWQTTISRPQVLRACPGTPQASVHRSLSTQDCPRSPAPPSSSAARPSHGTCPGSGSGRASARPARRRCCPACEARKHRQVRPPAPSNQQREGRGVCVCVLCALEQRLQFTSCCAQPVPQADGCPAHRTRMPGTPLHRGAHLLSSVRSAPQTRST